MKQLNVLNFFSWIAFGKWTIFVIFGNLSGELPNPYYPRFEISRIFSQKSHRRYTRGGAKEPVRLKPGPLKRQPGQNVNGSQSLQKKNEKQVKHQELQTARKYKVNLIHTLTLRCFHISSTPSLLRSCLNELRKLLLQNGYPTGVVNYNINVYLPTPTP